MSLAPRDLEIQQVGLESEQVKSTQTWGSHNSTRKERAQKNDRKYCQG